MHHVWETHKLSELMGSYYQQLVDEIMSSRMPRNVDLVYMYYEVAVTCFKVLFLYLHWVTEKTVSFFVQ